MAVWTGVTAVFGFVVATMLKPPLEKFGNSLADRMVEELKRRGTSAAATAAAVGVPAVPLPGETANVSGG